jgi:hypothetical protein
MLAAWGGRRCVASWSITVAACNDGERQTWR